MNELASFVAVFPSDAKLLGFARSFVENVGRYYGIDDGSLESLVLAVHEAVQNIVRHAHSGRDGARIELRGRRLESGAIEVQLIDQGQPFDIASVPHLDPGEVRLGGRGVFLIRRLVDEVYCEPCKPSGNVLRLVKYPRKLARPANW